MNVLIISDHQVGASVCDAFWKKLILGSMDPYIAEKKNRITFFHLRNTPMPRDQYAYNEYHNQDLDVIDDIEYEDGNDFSMMIEDLINRTSYDIIIFVNMMRTIVGFEFTTKWIKDMWPKCIVSSIGHEHNVAGNIDVSFNMQENGIDIVASDWFSDYVGQTDVFVHVSNHAKKELFDVIVSELMNNYSSILRLRNT